MALDGLVIANLASELSRVLVGGRITKIAQPEKDALLLTVKTADGARKLLLSANASLPFVYLTEDSFTSPLNAPTFCMSLRKHIGSGRILSVTQPDFERILRFEISHLDEMGFEAKKVLIAELMGKHSNLIFTDENDRVIDAIKHIGPTVSSMRIVLPGSSYFIAGQTGKISPVSVTSEQEFTEIFAKLGDPCARALSGGLTGISPLIANELCHRASIEGDEPISSLQPAELHRLWVQFEKLMEQVRTDRFSPQLVKRMDKPIEFSVTTLTSYGKGYESVQYESVSEMLECYFKERDTYTRVRQKSADLRKVLVNALERDEKKRALMEKQYRDTKKMEQYRLYGELLRAYAYAVEPGAKEYEAYDYNSGEQCVIPLKSDLSAIENANAYFAKYNKCKRTKTALDTQLAEVREEIDYLKTVLMSLEFAGGEADLNAIREELYESGFLRVKSKDRTKHKQVTSEPLHFVSSDGFHIYVGKNNLQNEALSLKFAKGSDVWFHAKQIPGCHVIVKTEGKELPDQTYEEAAMLAGYYSSGRDEGKLEIDYVPCKELKKPPGSAKGYVIYHTNYSMVVEPKVPENVKIC